MHTPWQIATEIAVGDTAYFTIGRHFGGHARVETGTVAKVTATRQILVTYTRDGTSQTKRFSRRGTEMGGLGYCQLIDVETYEKLREATAEAEARGKIRTRLEALASLSKHGSKADIIAELRTLMILADGLPERDEK